MGNYLIKYFLFPILFLISSFLIIFFSNDFRLVGYVVLCTSPLLSFVFVIQSANMKRDVYIANSIIEKVKANNYSNILINCGNAHVSGIAKNLKQAGIEIDSIKWSGKR